MITDECTSRDNECELLKIKNTVAIRAIYVSVCVIT